MLQGKTILITGGAGLVGSTIADQLVALEPNEIRVLDNFSRGRLANLASAIAEHRQALTDGRSGIHVLALLEAASRSAENGGTRIPVVMEAYK